MNDIARAHLRTQVQIKTRVKLVEIFTYYHCSFLPSVYTCRLLLSSCVVFFRASYCFGVFYWFQFRQTFIVIFLHIFILTYVQVI